MAKLTYFVYNVVISSYMKLEHTYKIIPLTI